MTPGPLGFLGDFAPYVAILLAAALPTHVWRWLGVAFAGRLDESSETLAWVRSVATAMVAAVISRLILFPTGALAEVPVALRLLAAGAGLGAYLGSGRRLLVGIAVAEGVLIAAWVVLVARP